MGGFSIGEAGGRASIFAPSRTRASERKVDAVIEKAEEFRRRRLGLKRFWISVAVDARVDVPVEAESLEEAMEDARYGGFSWDPNAVEVVSATPVNISSEDGELLRDFC